MKPKIFCLLLIVILLTFQEINVQAQITRGASPGELYLSGDWYLENYSILHYAIFRSTDNGANISLQYENIETPPTGEMKVGIVLGDASSGALYNYGNNELWLSFDYGESWEYIENVGGASYTSGSINGEIYKNGTDVSGTLYYSENFGYDFNVNNTNIKFRLEVATQYGELYGLSGIAGIGYNLKHSLDFGQNFNSIPIDSAVAFWAPSGQFPKISRGAEAGEIYLTSWTPELHYKIFHSVDTGYTWTEKYESDYIDIYYWSVQFTAGREQGSFYVMRSRINPAGDHVWLYIDYSYDYGETFNTYFHDLDSTITNISLIKPVNIILSNSPNPANTKTTFRFQLPKNCNNPIINIYNTYGNLIRQIDISGKYTQTWDGKDNKGNRVKEGLYLYNISYDYYSSQFNKLLIIN